MEKELRISVQTGGWYENLFQEEEHIEEAFAYIKACGFDVLDFGLDVKLRPNQIERGELTDFYDADIEALLAYYRPVKEAMEHHGISLGQAHAPFPVYVEGNDRVNAYMLQVIEKDCAILQYLGCHALVVHPYCCEDKEKEKEINLNLYRSLIPAARKYHVTICLENMFRVKCEHIVSGACATAEEARWYIDTLNEEAGEKLFGFCFDVGHANILSRDIRQELKILGERVTILHIHDNDGTRDLHQIPFTQKADWGKKTYTDWEGLLQGLRDIHYCGTLNFETYASLCGIPKALVPSMLHLVHDIGEYFKEEIQK